MPQTKEDTAAAVPQEERKTNKERLKEITDGIEAGIKEVFASDKYRNYLDTMSRFHKYSVNNTMLIYMQKPDATLVAGFNKWRDQFGRSVMKDERGIRIIAPTPFKKKVEIEKRDPDTHAVLLDPDGKPITETKTMTVPMFKPVTVFDVSQTQGKELPHLAETLHGKVHNFDLLRDAICAAAPVPVEFKPLSKSEDGAFSRREQNIVIRDDMSEAQTICALLHETAHSVLHNQKAGETEKPAKTEEIEAESIAYTVAKFFGIDTDENSFGYLASWLANTGEWSADKDVSELRASLETINAASSDLISSIEKAYKARAQELEQTAEQPAVSPPAMEKNVPPEPEIQPIVQPDPTVDLADVANFGYASGELIPLTLDRAAELMEAGCEIYLLHDDGSESLAVALEDVLQHYGYCGIGKVEWLRMSDAVAAKDAAKAAEQGFLDNPKDSFAIYMLRDTEETRDIRYLGSDQLEAMHIPVDKANYEFKYAGSLFDISGTVSQKLEQIYELCNLNHPSDYDARSLSVSDIIALKQNGAVSYYYVDSAGFRDLPQFDGNPLKAAELSMEDDADMIDGVINNGKKKETEAVTADTSAKKEKKPSVLKKLNALKAEIAANPTDPKERTERSI